MMSYKTFTFKNTNDNIKLVSKPMFIIKFYLFYCVFIATFISILIPSPSSGTQTF